MTNNFFSAIILIMHMQLIGAQTIKDVIRYSSADFNGSARFTAMGGAFGALGGDLSAVSINPAASTVFLSNEIGFTVRFSNEATRSKYFGTQTEQEKSKFNFNQGGAAFVLNNTREDADWSRIGFGINVQGIADFDSNYLVVGNSDNGLDRFFLFYANPPDGVKLIDLELLDGETFSERYRDLGEFIGYSAQQAFLAYQGEVINPVSNDDNNTAYTSNASYNSVNHHYQFKSSGHHRRYSFNVGGLYKKILHLGLNVNAHSIYFSNFNSLFESGYASDSAVKQIEFNNESITRGNGISVQFGAIAKFSKSLRIGLTYDSPQWLKLSKEGKQHIITKINNNEPEAISPNVTNAYVPYRLRIPSKITGSLAYIYKNKGILSVDFSTSNYGNTTFMDADNYLREQNSIVEATFKSTMSVRFGGEYRLEKISLRAGMFYDGSHRKDNADDRVGYAFGFGYDFGSGAFNFSMVNQRINDVNSLYSKGLTNPYSLNRSTFQILAGCNFKL